MNAYHMLRCLGVVLFNFLANAECHAIRRPELNAQCPLKEEHHSLQKRAIHLVHEDDLNPYYCNARHVFLYPRFAGTDEEEAQLPEETYYECYGHPEGEDKLTVEQAPMHVEEIEFSHVDPAPVEETPNKYDHPFDRPPMSWDMYHTGKERSSCVEESRHVKNMELNEMVLHAPKDTADKNASKSSEECNDNSDLKEIGKHAEKKSDKKNDKHSEVDEIPAIEHEFPHIQKIKSEKHENVSHEDSTKKKKTTEAKQGEAKDNTHNNSDKPKVKDELKKVLVEKNHSKKNEDKQDDEKDDHKRHEETPPMEFIPRLGDDEVEARDKPIVPSKNENPSLKKSGNLLSSS